MMRKECPLARNFLGTLRDLSFATRGRLCKSDKNSLLYDMFPQK